MALSHDPGSPAVNLARAKNSAARLAAIARSAEAVAAALTRELEECTESIKELDRRGTETLRRSAR